MIFIKVIKNLLQYKYIVINKNIVLDYIYWSDDEQGIIMRIKRDGTGRQIIVNHEHSGETTLGTWVSGIFNLNF